MKYYYIPYMCNNMFGTAEVPAESLGEALSKLNSYLNTQHHNKPITIGTSTMYVSETKLEKAK